MTTINRKQPMRPAEIDLLNQVDTNTDDIATQTERLTQEIINRTNNDNVLQQKIDAESKARADADTVLQSHIDTEAKARADADSTLQENIAAEQTRAEAAESTLTTNLANEVTARTRADTTLQQNIDAESKARADSDAELEQEIQDQLTFLQSVPAHEFGKSNTIDVQANSSTSIDISFGSPKTEIPIVLCSLQNASGNLSCIVTGVTNEQFSVTVHNLSSTNVSGVTIGWLAISGR